MKSSNHTVEHGRRIDSSSDLLTLSILSASQADTLMVSRAPHGNNANDDSFSTSSRTPSSCNIDDVESQDFSDVSSLDGSDFELIESIHRPSSVLSARSLNDGTRSHSFAIDQTNQWASLPRFNPHANNPTQHVENHHSETSATVHSSATITQSSLSDDANQESEDQTANLLNSDLTLTVDIVREGSGFSATSSTTAESLASTPQGSMLHRTSSRGETMVANAHGQQYTADSPSSMVASHFEFPDPLSVSSSTFQPLPAAGPVDSIPSQETIRAKRTANSDGLPSNPRQPPPPATSSRMSDRQSEFSMVSRLNGKSSALRNRWTPTPSNAKSVFSAPSAKQMASNCDWTPQSPTFSTKSTTMMQTKDGTNPSQGSMSDSLERQFEPPRRPVQKTCVDLPAVAHVYYVGRRPSAAVMWRISQSVRASLGESIGESFKQCHEQSIGPARILNSVAGNPLGTRVLHLTETDCTVPFGDAKEAQSVTRFLNEIAAPEVVRSNALIVCCLDNQEASSQSSLPLHLASLLGALHQKVKLSSLISVPKPLVLPTLCPSQANNLDDQDSIISEGHKELVEQLTQRIDAQLVDREWNTVVAETMRILKSTCSAPHLHVDFAPGTTFESVIPFETLISSASSWFNGDPAWACRAALPLAQNRSSLFRLLDWSAEERTERAAPVWLVKTRRWLRGSIQDNLDLANGQITVEQVLPTLSGRDVGMAAVADQEKPLNSSRSKAAKRSVGGSVPGICLFAIFLISVGALLIGSNLNVFPLSIRSSWFKSGGASVVPSPTLSRPMASLQTVVGSSSSSALSSETLRATIPSSQSKGLFPAAASKPTKLAQMGSAMKSKQITNEPRKRSKTTKALTIKSQLAEKNSGLSTYRRRNLSDLYASNSKGFQRASSDGSWNDFVWDAVLQASKAAKEIMDSLAVSWEHWLNELMEFYNNVLLPNAKEAAREASRQARELARQTRVQVQALVETIKKVPDSKVVRDASKGADKVFKEASQMADTIAKRVKVASGDGRIKLEASLREAARGASVASQSASHSFNTWANQFKVGFPDL